MDFIKSIASDLDSCKDVTKFSVQIKTLFALQQNVDNSEKSGQMIRASSKLQGGVKSQNQKNRNRHFSKPNGKVQSTYQDNNKQKQKSGSNQNNNPPGNFNLRKPQKSYQQPSKPRKAIITKNSNFNKFNNTKEQNNFKNACTRCGNLSHKVGQCLALKHRDGSILPLLSKNKGNSNPFVYQLNTLCFHYDDYDFDDCQG